MKERIFHSYFTVILTVLISTFLLWLPFLLGVNTWLGLNFTDHNFLTIYKHYDGLLYVVPAKTMYQPELIRNLRLELLLEPIYFAAHLPLYPALISIFIPIIGSMKAMLLVSVVFSLVLAVFFYYFLKYFNLTVSPIILVAVFLFLPRFMVVRSVGAPETMFMFFILSSIFFFEQKKYFLAGLLGGLATMTKSPGILLFIAYGLVLVEKLIREKKIEWRAFPIGLIPLSLLGVFMLYYFQYNDFFAYFNSGDNLHLVSPFAVFNFEKRWVGTAWLEEVLFYFLMYILTVITLKDTKYRSFFYFSLVFLLATMFVDHRDIARYSLPLWPFACIAFEKFFTSKKFLIATLILLPGIYLYAWNFSLYNILPVSDWRPFLP